MKTPLLIELFDFYGKDIPLQIFSSPKKKSLFGAIMGVLSLFSIGAISIYFLITLFSRDTKQIISNKSTTLIPQNNLTAVPFLIYILDSMSVPILPNAGIYEVHAFYFNQKWANNEFKGLEMTQIKLRPCTREDLAGVPVSDSSLAVSLCVPFGKYDLTMNGYWGDVVKGFSWFTFYLTKCNPNNNNNCRNATVIDRTLNPGYFNIASGVGVVDNDNANPMKLTVPTNTIITSTSLYKMMVINYDQNLYTDDEGFVFESLVTHDFFTQGSTVNDYSLDAPTGLPYLNGSVPVAAVSFQNSANVITTKRTFLKAQAILANIGGVIKFIMVCAQIITQFVVRKNVFITIGNEVFDYRERKGVTRIVKKLNNVLEIEGRTENDVPNLEINPRREENKNDVNDVCSPLPLTRKVMKRNFGPSSSNQITRNESRVSKLKLSLYQLLCITNCVKNKKLMSQYEATERTILEKVSIHSIIRDSYKLDKLSKFTLDSDQYRKLNENIHMPIRDMS